MVGVSSYFSPSSSVSTTASISSGFFLDAEAASPKLKSKELPLLRDFEAGLEPLSCVDRCHRRLGLSWRSAFCLALSMAALLGLATGVWISSVTASLKSTAGTYQELAPTSKSPRPLDGQAGFTVLHVQGRAIWIYEPPMKRVSRKAVIVLHGSQDSAEGIADASRFHEVAARAEPGFLVVYPEMATLGGAEWGTDAKEESFFQDLVALLASKFNRDEVYVTGHSAGGSMALWLQNNMPNLFKAAAAVEAGLSPGFLPRSHFNRTSRGLPTLVVWNHNDPVLQACGGEQAYQFTVDTLRRHDASSSGPAQVSPLPAGFQGVVSAERRMWKASMGQPSLTVVSWHSAEPLHHWVNNRSLPGSPLDASILIWDFFQAAGADLPN